MATRKLDVLAMVDELYNPKISQNKAIDTLRKVMGILPKSERGSSDKFDVELKPKETDPAKIKLESDIHNLLNKHKRLYGKKARHKQAKNYRKSRASSRHGGQESLYNKSKLVITGQDFVMQIDRKDFFCSGNISGLRSSTEKVMRYDLNINISANSYLVETVTDSRTESTIQRILQFVARAAAPIYGQTCLQMANTLRIQGDDTSTRVLEIERRVRDAEGESILEEDALQKFKKHLEGDEKFQIKTRNQI